MEFLSQTYVALRGPTGAPQTPADIIARLSDRLSPATLLADRRASVLALKGLVRDCKQDVGDRALTGLLQVLENDAEVDAEIGKAALETLLILCETEDAPELGFKHTDIVLANERVINVLFTLLGDTNFYIRFSTLQYLSILLQNRRQVVQGYFLKVQVGPGSIVAVLEDKREIIRNESLSMVQALISQSSDIQKVLAFEGAFERLFAIVTQEGGIEGGHVPQEALTCIDGLLRFNSSNQSYFRESQSPPILCNLLLFPPSLQFHQPAPQEFALQFWDSQKTTNASMVVGIIGMLASTKGNPVQEVPPFTRCLVEIALASNAPTSIKTQALRLLPPHMTMPLSELVLTPYMPVPESNGEEWDRLEPASALDALVELALHGEYNGLEASKRTKEGLELRTAAVTVFENFARKEDIKQAIVQAMLPPEGSATDAPPVTPLIHSLISSPAATSILDLAAISSTHLASWLFAHLIRTSPRAKTLALAITPPAAHGPADPNAGGAFFVPADGPPAAGQPVTEEADDDEPPQALLHILCENLSLAFLSRSRADNSEREAREWDRLIVAYLTLFSQWLWEDPSAVREFLNAGGLGVLVEAANQTSEADSIIPGTTIHPIINRLGVETLIGRMTRLREDERFRAIVPDSVVLPYPQAPSHLHAGLQKSEPVENEGEIWFDWGFVDFWKSNYYAVQRGLATDPHQISASSSGAGAESAMLVASLREVIQNQAKQIEDLQNKLKDAQAYPKDDIAALKGRVDALASELKISEEKRKEQEKEQEDMLVLLDELSSKRSRDKKRMQEEGLEVSEDEGDEEDDDE
ncbi:hypothetical protein CCMSSC00406_0009417 [Pleurotus cornucopiae]|uniref:Uncharacterized protein n=1 Tax=Pleurotus cornucopiae TaxID=5321 RepID=A0ACB7ITY6_PLECO|nr:hypothetical protein CCMSSC00406_0009417 [Pleurotus cornucopiae]